MTPKQNVLRFVATLPDDVSYERILYHVGLMHAVEESEADAAAGRVIDHDELFDRIEAEYAESQPPMDRSRNARSRKHSSVPRSKSPANGSGVRKKAKGRRRTAKKAS
jgi:hypothetical protein